MLLVEITALPTRACTKNPTNPRYTIRPANFQNSQPHSTLSFFESFLHMFMIIFG